MEIIHKLEDGLFSAKTLEELKDRLHSFLVSKGYETEVAIKGDTVVAEIPAEDIKKGQRDFDNANMLCHQRKFAEAKPILEKVVKTLPLWSDAYRTLAQVTREFGIDHVDEAIDINIDALRIEPSNVWALVLMGNLYGRDKGDLDMAEKYFRIAMRYFPDSQIPVNNLAAMLMEKKHYEEAIPLFEKSIELNNTYLQSYYGIAVCYGNIGQNRKKFEILCKGLKMNVYRPENKDIRLLVIKEMCDTAQEIGEKEGDVFIKLVEDVKATLEERGGKEIRIEQSTSIDTYAKLEMAHVHKRPYHRVVFNPRLKMVEHVMCHELMHLHMWINADKVGRNKVVVNNGESLAGFKKKFSASLKQMQKVIPNDKFDLFVNHMCGGYTLQLMNCPLDLFVEDLIYKNVKKMRPLQFLSLFRQEEDNIKAIKVGSQNMPAEVVRLSKILNIVTSLHMKDLYGVDFIAEFKPTKQEMAQAQDLYDEYKAYTETFKDGDEWELLEYFRDATDSESFLILEDEKKAMAKKDYYAEHATHEGEDDYLTSEEKEQQREFNESQGQSDPARDMMMTMYMLGAMQFLSKLSFRIVQTISMEIAMRGVQGISPSKKNGYSVPSMPGRDFSGYQFLAYYYVSWAIAAPEKVGILGLPYKDAYDAAYKMFEKQGGKYPKP